LEVISNISISEFEEKEESHSHYTSIDEHI
jgi:hypothetical protein